MEVLSITVIRVDPLKIVIYQKDNDSRFNIIWKNQTREKA
jgi:hypothetical protein